MVLGKLDFHLEKNGNSISFMVHKNHFKLEQLKDLLKSPEILKLLGESIGKALEDTGKDKDFLERALIAQKTIQELTKENEYT